jgi:hypothetical protein
VVGNNYGLGGSAKAGMKGDALNDEIGLAMARHVGLRFVEVAGKIQNGGRLFWLMRIL